MVDRDPEDTQKYQDTDACEDIKHVYGVFLEYFLNEMGLRPSGYPNRGVQ